MQPVLIESTEDFDRYFEKICNDSYIAVDTEFFRETTYFPHLGLVQIANSEVVACIDPIAFDARDALATVLLDEQLIKVFHSCSQDLEVLHHYIGQTPNPIHDTQIAASLISEDEQIGYANLVEKELGLMLDKSQTRTNWLRRPLTGRQLDYAADDVIYLYHLYSILIDRLREKGREAWFLEDCRATTTSESNFEPDLSNCLSRVKGTHKLPGLELAIIEQIATWREKIAIKKDLTRRKVMPDDLIVKLAHIKPNNEKELSAIHPLRKLFKAKEISSLSTILLEAYQLTPDKWPSRTRSFLTPDEKSKLKELQKKVDEKAKDLGVSSSTLCSRKEISGILEGQTTSRCTAGWRFDVIGKSLLDSVV